MDLTCYFFPVLILSLTVYTATGQFVHSPTNQEPVEGSRLSLTCSSAGGWFTVWRKEGELISSNSHHFTILSDITGSSSTLTIESANHTQHSGQYDCMAIFSDSTMDTARFNITVQYIGSDIAIRLEAEQNCSSAGVVEAGCGVRLECLPPSGYPEVRVSWYRNGVKLRQSDTPGIDFSHNKRILSIASATYDDSGAYQCRATNDVGTTGNSRLVPVRVRGDGREFGFVGNVSVEVVAVGKEATLSLDCSVEDAIGSVVFQWRAQTAGEEEGVAGEVEGGGRVSITSTANSSVLRIDQVALMDEGVHYCVAADSLTELTKRFIVSVHVPRTIVKWPPPEVVDYEGETIQFDCIASGRPIPTVIWLFQSTTVVPLAPDSVNSGLQDLGNGSLLIPNLQAQHAGTYFCMLQQPPLNIRTFTLTVVPQSSPMPSVVPSPAGNSTFNAHFTIGPFSRAVSIGLVTVCGLFLLLLLSAVLTAVSCCCCCYCCGNGGRSGSQPAPEKEKQELGTAELQYDFAARNYLSQQSSCAIGRGGDEGMVELPAVSKRAMMELPPPPAPAALSNGGTSHYEAVEEMAGGVCRPRLPTFSSDTSEAVTTELETVVSAATDTHLVTTS